MTIKKILRQYIFTAIVFFLAPLLSAQLEESPVAAGDTEPRYLQRITWALDEYALRYEVVVEKETEGEYRRVLREFTGSSFIGVSLPKGRYRCRVIPYDYLDRPGEGSQWMNFELHPVQEPVPVQLTEPVYPIDNREGAPKKRKVFDVYLGLQWMPFISVYGEENNFLDKDPSLAAAAFRLDIITSKRNFINPGLEFTVSWHKTAEHHVAAADINLLAQKWFAKRDMALRIRTGAGISLLPDKFDIQNLPGEGFHVNLGLSFIWLPREHFFLELGLDFSQFFTEDISGCFQPFLGPGIRK